MRTPVIAAAAVLLSAAGARAGWCDIIDFQSLEVADPNVHQVGPVYDEDGYRLTQGPGGLLWFYGTQHPLYAGSTALFNDAGVVNILRRIDGAPFSITCIDLATLAGVGPTEVVFTGFLPGGASVEERFVVEAPGGTNALERLVFDNRFSALERVEWRQDGPGHQFDRLVVAVPSTLDFEALRQNNAQVNAVGPAYEEDGYVFRKRLGELFPFASFGTLEPRFAGSTALFNDAVIGVSMLERLDGGPFDIAGVRLATLNLRGPTTVAFSGTRFDGGSVFQEFEVDAMGGRNVLQGFVFTEEFRAITLLEWVQEWPYHQFDDLVVSCANACYADCDPSTGPGVLDIFDFLCFQNRFAAQEPYACDCDLSTGQGVCDVFDFLCFQNLYAAGCP